MREDVELLNTQAISGKPVKDRADLNPPFAGQVASDNAKEHLADLRAQEQAKAHLLDAMTPRERASYRKSRVSRSGSSATTRKQGPSGKGDMMEGLELFRKSQKPRKGG